MWFVPVLMTFDRVAVTGGPRTGKTSLAMAVSDRPAFSTDEFRTSPWEEVPGKVVEKAKGLGKRFLVEGTQVPRALRKGLEVDVVVHLTQPREALTSGQASMSKAVATVIADWKANHDARGVPVLTPGPGTRGWS